MRRPLARITVPLAVVVLVLVLAACGGGDDEPTPSPTPGDGEAPAETTTPGTPGSLPPKFVECMADQGFDVKSAADIHSAPPQALQSCFGSLHQDGGAP